MYNWNKNYHSKKVLSIVDGRPQWKVESLSIVDVMALSLFFTNWPWWLSKNPPPQSAMTDINNTVKDLIVWPDTYLKMLYQCDTVMEQSMLINI